MDASNWSTTRTDPFFTASTAWGNKRMNFNVPVDSYLTEYASFFPFKFSRTEKRYPQFSSLPREKPAVSDPFALAATETDFRNVLIYCECREASKLKFRDRSKVQRCSPNQDSIMETISWLTKHLKPFVRKSSCGLRLSWASSFISFRDPLILHFELKGSLSKSSTSFFWRSKAGFPFIFTTVQNKFERLK